VIVLDTNQLHAHGIERNPHMLMLRAVARVAGHRLAVPAMVEHEYLSWYRDSVIRAINTARRLDDLKSREQLLRLVPWWADRAGFANGESTLPILESVVVDERQKLLHSLFEVLPPPPGAAEEGHQREISRRPPAVQSGEAGKGARDTAIWLTALEAARTESPYNVYFITRDEGFGEAKLKPELSQEAPGNLVYFDSTDRLIDRLSCPADPPLSRDEMTNSGHVSGAVRAYMIGGQFRLTVQAWLPAGVRWPMELTDELSPDSSEETPLARRIGELTLVTFRSTWTLEREFLDVPDGGVRPGAPGSHHRVRVTVPLGVLAVFEGGVFSRVHVLSEGGLMPAG
jgi:predicted nucleic acid-binding protein